MNKVKITETILRDAHQSLIATRLTTKDMVPVLELLDQVGYHALEMWGGATFDASLSVSLTLHISKKYLKSLKKLIFFVKFLNSLLRNTS